MASVGIISYDTFINDYYTFFYNIYFTFFWFFSLLKYSNSSLIRSHGLSWFFNSAKALKRYFSANGIAVLSQGSPSFLRPLYVLHILYYSCEHSTCNANKPRVLRRWYPALFHKMQTLWTNRPSQLHYFSFFPYSDSTYFFLNSNLENSLIFIDRYR